MIFRRAALLVLLAAACATCSAAPAHAQGGIDPPGVDPTHYWSYRLSPALFLPDQVFVSDAFFTGLTPVMIDSLQRVVNWVVKDHAPLPDTTKRYTWWNIRTKLPNLASGLVSNQRGEFGFEVFELQFLLVPATLHQPLAGAPSRNHYLCYRADGPTPTGTYHQMQDEWHTEFQLLGPPSYLCVPCLAQIAGVTYPIVDPNEYLSLYEIQPSSDLLSARVEDAFISGFRAFRQRPFEYVMLPSTFRPLATPAQRSTWGRVKTLYR